MTVLVESRSSGVRTITLNRPERLNAVNGELADALPRLLDAAATDDSVRVVVITGAGRGFCAGLDLSEPPALPQSTRAERLDPLAWVGRWVLSIVGCEKPVIAAINGPAAGAGFGLALAADIRLMSAAATLSPAYVRRGLSPDAGVSYILPRLIGGARAAEILLTGRDVDATEAERIGLASVVFPAAEFAEGVQTFADRLALGAPIAQALTKRLLAASADASLGTQLVHELSAIKTCFATNDAAEALKAFAERRPPVFRGA